MFGGREAAVFDGLYVSAEGALNAALALHEVTHELRRTTGQRQPEHVVLDQHLAIGGAACANADHRNLNRLGDFRSQFARYAFEQQQALLDRAGPAGIAPEQVPVQLQQQVNADGKLKVNGLEFQITQPLDFATRLIGVEGFGVQGNLTLIDQRGEGQVPAVALGVSPTTYTLTGYYEGNGLSARLTYTYNEGSVNSGLNQNGIPAAAIVGRNYGQLDFSGNIDLGKILGNDYLPTVVVNVININKEAQSSYFQFPNATFNEYNPGRTVLVGVRGRF